MTSGSGAFGCLRSLDRVQNLGRKPGGPVERWIVEERVLNTLRKANSFGLLLPEYEKFVVQ